MRVLLQRGESFTAGSPLHSHVRSCGRCRSRILLLTNELAQQPHSEAGATTCATCKTDLAAFIELEQTNPSAAAATFPHVYRHLWVCPDCALTYELTQELLAAERAGTIRPLPRPAPQAPRSASRLLQQIKLPRAMLMLALPTSYGALAVARGSDDPGYVLYDDAQDEPEPRQITVAVHKDGPGTWRLEVRTTPPVVGILVVTAGAISRSAPFDSGGVAVIDAIAASLLTDPDGPDLDLRIITHEG